ncbi:MAG TPA: hypothetical protein VK133_02510 [Amoebophilaceae bacterium]|nr:hypothetical protein [Amoebophilaceae bacterium]
MRMKRSTARDVFADSPSPSELEIDISSDVETSSTQDADGESITRKKSRQSSIVDRDSNAGLDEILEVLNSSGKSSPGVSDGVASGSTAGMFATAIKTGLPDRNEPATVRQMYDIAESHFKENENVGHIVFAQKASVKAAWPVCTLTMRSASVESMTSLLSSGEQKMFSVQFPPFTKLMEKPSYFLYKKAFEHSHVLKLSEQGLQKLIDSSPDIFRYLESIEGQNVRFGQGLPNRPEGIVLENVDQTTRIILQVDDIDNRRSLYKVTPNISIRLNRLSRDGVKWYPDRAGITISPSNYFYFVEGTLRIYLQQVKEMISEFAEVFSENHNQISALAHKAAGVGMQ